MMAHSRPYLFRLLVLTLFLLTIVHATGWLNGIKQRLKSAIIPWKKTYPQQESPVSFSLECIFDPVAVSSLTACNGVSNCPRTQTNRDNKHWKSELPSSLSPNRTAALERIELFDDGYSSIVLYLVGTFHDSKESCGDIWTLLDHVKLDIILVELCPKRTGVLSTPSQSQPASSHPSNKTTITRPPTTIKSFLQDVVMTRKRLQISTFCAIHFELLVERNRIVNDASPSSPQVWDSEFQAAFQWWVFHGAKKNKTAFILGDRDIGQTMQRYWREESFWNKCALTTEILWKVVWSINDEVMLAKEVERQQDVIQEVLGTENGVANQLSGETNAYKNVFYQERNAFLACNIQRSCSDYLARLPEKGRCRKVRPQPTINMVAIVGAGHVRGIHQLLQEGIANDVILDRLIDDVPCGTTKNGTTGTVSGLWKIIPKLAST